MRYQKFCKKCGNIIFEDYYGFCSNLCLMDFATKNELLLLEAQNYKDDAMRELEEKIGYLEEEISSLEFVRDSEYEYEGLYNDKCNEYYHQTHKLEEERKKNKELTEKIKELTEKNKVLYNKYHRFEIIDLDD